MAAAFILKVSLTDSESFPEIVSDSEEVVVQEMSFYQARLAAGFTRRGLSEAMGASLSTIEAYESGDVGPRNSGKRTPHGRTMKRFANTLGREVMDITEFQAVLGFEPRHEPRHDLSVAEGDSDELAAEIRDLIERHTSREIERRTLAGAEVKQ